MNKYMNDDERKQRIDYPPKSKPAPKITLFIFSSSLKTGITISIFINLDYYTKIKMSVLIIYYGELIFFEEVIINS